MSKHVTTLIGILLVLVISFGASADQMTLSSHQAMESWVPLSNNLDETFEDSISYHNFTNGYYYYSDATDFYSGVRFTAPADFTLQGFRFLISRAEELETVTVSVYTNDGGQPDELLLTILDDEAPNEISLLDEGWDPPYPGWVECLIDEADWIDFTMGDDFWIVVGPVPGDVSGGWSTVIDQDDAVPGERSKTGFNDSPTDLGSAVPYDYIFNALGEYAGTFIDVVAMSCFNDIQQFQLAADTEVNLSARFRNPGTEDSPEGTVTFTILDEDSNEVFTVDETLPAISGFNADTALVEATTSWSPDETGRYIVSATSDIGDENDTENNTAKLLQQVVEAGSWYVYDDGDFNVSVNMTDTEGYGTRFYPISYPAMIDSATWYFDEDFDAVTLAVWILSEDEFLTAWEYSGAVVEGWNSFAIESDDFPEGVSIQSGSFVMGVYGDGSFMLDSQPPVAASNVDMPNVGMQYNGGTLYLDESGNWGMRPRILGGVSPELFFPTTELEFGVVEPGEVGEQVLSIWNYGTGTARLDSIYIPNNISDVISVDESFPIMIDPDTTETTLTFLWAPQEGDDDLNGGVLLHHNDPSAQDPMPILLGGLTVVREVDATIPTEYFMEQNYPNPFNPTTSIQFGLKATGHVTMTVFNVMGQQVMQLVDQPMTTGVHEVTFDASQLASGIYYYQIQVNNFNEMKKMTLIK